MDYGMPKFIKTVHTQITNNNVRKQIIIAMHGLFKG